MKNCSTQYLKVSSIAELFRLYYIYHWDTVIPNTILPSSFSVRIIIIWLQQDYYYKIYYRFYHHYKILLYIISYYTGLLETALQSGLTTSYDFLAVWRTYCDIIRRKINWANLDQSLLDKLREIFSRATQHLMECELLVTTCQS